MPELAGINYYIEEINTESGYVKIFTNIEADLDENANADKEIEDFFVAAYQALGFPNRKEAAENGEAIAKYLFPVTRFVFRNCPNPTGLGE